DEETEALDEADEVAEHQDDEIDEKQEASPETEPEAETQENLLDAPELIFMSPSFWESLESELSEELEQLEPEEDLEEEPTNEEGC
ncbi:MAG: hypothetical protein ABSC14_08435, partial [Desulfomonilia bacterium]